MGQDSTGSPEMSGSLRAWWHHLPCHMVLPGGHRTHSLFGRLSPGTNSCLRADTLGSQPNGVTRPPADTVRPHCPGTGAVSLPTGLISGCWRWQALRKAVTLIQGWSRRLEPVAHKRL